MAVAGESQQTQDDIEPILSQLEKVCRSVQFARAERLQQFLRFVVEAKLAGRIQDLKETVIGVSIYVREPGYDPKIEPIVRNEARRLRRKLDEYYLGDGQNDSVLISIPLGGYSPAFAIREVRVPTAPVISEVTAIVMPPALDEVPEPKGSGLRSPIAILLLVGVIALLFYLTFGRRTIAPTLRAITRYEGYEIHPNLSPEGARVAFVWDGGKSEYNIYVRRLDSDRLLRLTYGKGHDLYPSWSPDGKQIAFLRLTSSQEKSIVIVPAEGGAERTLCRTAAIEPVWVAAASIISDYSPGPDWSADGRQLVITDKSALGDVDSLYLVNAKTGEKKRLTAPAPETGDYFPVFSPSGRELAFIRKSDRPGRGGIFILSLKDGNVRQIVSTSGLLAGLTWLSNDRLVFARNTDIESVLCWVSSHGGSVRPLTGADRHADQPSAGRNGGTSLVYALSFRDANVWQSSRQSGKLSFGQASKLIAASGSTNSAQYSPDGNRIAFVSDRSGSLEIWTAKRDGSETTQLTRGHGVPVGSPRWSPDSKQIVYDSMKDGFSAIFVMQADGGSANVFAAAHEDYMMPTWSRDGNSIYYTVETKFASHAATAIWRKRLDSGEAIRLASGRGDVFETVDGKTIYFSQPAPGAAILRMPTAGGEPDVVQQLRGVEISRYSALGSGGLFFLADESAPWNIDYFDFQLQRRFPNVAFLHGAPEFGTPSLSISPDGQSIMFTQVDQSGSDLMLMTNAR